MMNTLQNHSLYPFFPVLPFRWDGYPINTLILMDQAFPENTGRAWNIPAQEQHLYHPGKM